MTLSLGPPVTDPWGIDDRYLDAARWLATRGPEQKGYRAVVFGHTHHAKDLAIPRSGARYLNTGTWSNLMKFPEVFTRKGATHDEIRTALFAFAKKLQTNDLDAYLSFDPTYVRLDLTADGTLVAGSLHTYDHARDRL